MARGKHTLDSTSSSYPRCISCLLCFSVCPSLALSLSAFILVTRYSWRWTILCIRCIFCASCIDVCPVIAIQERHKSASSYSVPLRHTIESG